MTGSESWSLLKLGDLKKETEVEITATQDQALRTNVIIAKTEHHSVSALCRMCGKSQETLEHIVCGCNKLEQKDYKKIQDIWVQVVH